MKKFLFLITALLFATTICAQERISILDICYYDKNTNEVNTYEQETVIKKLQKKGFKITNTEYEYGEGAGGYTVLFKYVTMYQHKSATTVTIGNEGVYAIEFKTTSDAEEFAANAVFTGYFTEKDGRFIITRDPDFGITSFEIDGKAIGFALSVP